MKKSLIVGIIITLLLLTGCVQQPTEAPTPTLTGEPPKTGDWIITGQQSFEDRSITLNGNLIIKRSGTLTLKGIRLLVNASFNGQYKISVEPGGSMYVYGSTIAAANPEHGFAFIVSGSAFEMKDSELHGAGWGPDTESWDSKDILSGANGLVVTTTGAVIENNILSDNYIGVILAGSGIALTKNKIHSNRIYGIFIYGGKDSRIIGNSIEHSTVSSPFRIVNGQNNMIQDNDIQSGINRGAIETFRSNANTFKSNTISGLGSGISLMFVSNNNTIVGNDISMDELGIQIWGWNNRVENNAISGAAGRSVTGIYMVYAYNTIVAGNTITLDKDLNGIMVRHSSNNVIFNNRLLTSAGGNRTSGILLFSSSKGNIMQGNILSRFPTGISLFFSSDRNQINNNEVSGDGSGSIYISDSLENTIYGNNFLGNGASPHDNGNNQWDYEGTGNYWSAYGGTDSNGNGVGDVPYAISPGGVDRFPIIKPLTLASSLVPQLEQLPVTDVSSTFSQTVVGKDVVIENQTIVLEHLTVHQGGTLTLKNVVLITGGAKDVSKLLARGGRLFVYDSKIIQMEYGNGFEIRADEGATFVMKNTEVHDVGHEWWYGGIQIYTENVVFENNIITDTILWFESSSSGARVVGNTISNSWSPIILSCPGSSGFTIADNTIQGSIDDGIRVEGGENNTIVGNEISNIAFGNGIAFRGNNGTIGGNKLSKVSFGSTYIIGNSNMISKNIISDSGGGVTVEGNGNQIKGNVASNVVSSGIDIIGSNNIAEGNTASHSSFGVTVSGNENSIYLNNFVDMYQGPRDEGKGTRWDNGIQGNYWSNYRGKDANGDGIGDTPYLVPPNGVDNYPLMKPYGQ